MNTNNTSNQQFINELLIRCVISVHEYYESEIVRTLV